MNYRDEIDKMIEWAVQNTKITTQSKNVLKGYFKGRKYRIDRLKAFAAVSPRKDDGNEELICYDLDSLRKYLTEFSWDEFNLEMDKVKA